MEEECEDLRDNAASYTHEVSSNRSSFRVIEIIILFPLRNEKVKLSHINYSQTNP